MFLKLLLSLFIADDAFDFKLFRVDDAEDAKLETSLLNDCTLLARFWKSEPTFERLPKFILFCSCVDNEFILPNADNDALFNEALACSTIDPRF